MTIHKAYEQATEALQRILSDADARNYDGQSGVWILPLWTIRNAQGRVLHMLPTAPILESLGAEVATGWINHWRLKTSE